VDIVEYPEQPLDLTVPAQEHAPGEHLRFLLPDPVRRQGAGDGEDPG
jgi:hypothetical protein